MSGGHSLSGNRFRALHPVSPALLRRGKPRLYEKSEMPSAFGQDAESM